jgi:hypothetical protein
MCLLHALHADDELAAGSSEHCAGYSGPMNGGELLEKLNDYQHLKKISAPRILFRQVNIPTNGKQGAEENSVITS